MMKVENHQYIHNEVKLGIINQFYILYILYIYAFIYTIL